MKKIWLPAIGLLFVDIGILCIENDMRFIIGVDCFLVGVVIIALFGIKSMGGKTK
ncbi:MAG: hypothetical protein PHH73_00275 [Candidatus Rickettsiella isopodorum]|nr:hypothetical protein [Candidatus Rickettsiella isopodorum]